MFENLLNRLGMDTDSKSGTDKPSRRRFTRRESDKCVSVVNGKTYPVENWSLGGVLLYADSKNFAVNQEVPITIKFKMSENILNVSHKARVIRKSMYHVAFEFAPLTKQIRHAFQSVVDDAVSGEFANSQFT